MLRPLNTLATWLLGIAGMLNVLHVFGCVLSLGVRIPCAGHCLAVRSFCRVP